MQFSGNRYNFYGALRYGLGGRIQYQELVPNARWYGHMDRYENREQFQFHLR